MNKPPNIARLLTEICQRSLLMSEAYWRKPTKLELGSIREPVNEIHMVQAVTDMSTTITSMAGASASIAAAGTQGRVSARQTGSSSAAQDRVGRG